MPSLDIFNDDAFSVVSLTDFINDVKYRPGRIGQMGLFSTSRVSTTSVAIERIGDIIQIVEPQPRGAPGKGRDMPKRTIQDLRVPHFPRPWGVSADSVQNVRAKGSESELETVQNVVGEVIAANAMDFDVTEEACRLGAVTGIVSYQGDAEADLNLFTAFGIAQPAEVDFDLDNANPAEGVLRKKCATQIRNMRKALGAVPFTEVHSFVGDNFFDDLLSHPEVRETYKGWSEAQILRESYIGKNRGENPMFEFGGIVWENYGEIDGEGVGINTDKAQFFPTGVPNLFRTYYAPANYNETVNTLGERLYAKQETAKFDKGVEGELQMNALHICTRPATLLRAKRT